MNIPYNSELITTRLTLKPYKEEDFHALYKLISDNNQRLRMSFPKLTTMCNSPENTRAFIIIQKEEWQKKEKFSFGIYHKDELAGHIFFKAIDWKIFKAEVGYLIDEKYEGRGLVSESLNAMLEFAFTKLGLQKIFLRVIPVNRASAKVALRCGFKLEGLLRKEFKTLAGDLVDVEYYGKLKTD